MVSRRTFLASTGLLASAVAGAAATSLVKDAQSEAARAAVGEAKVPSYGFHQPGIELELQSFARFVAFDLSTHTDRAAMLRWMSLITDDIVRLTDGRPVLADPTSVLAAKPARLTVTVGFGPGLFSKLKLEHQRPIGFAELPKFELDELVESESYGDVLFHIAADDLISLSHASRSLIRDSEDFANVRWVQDGFTNSQGVEKPGKTQRNLMGQVDGTDNPVLGSEDFSQVVWIDEGPDWCIGGTQLALRKIRMNLDTWEALSTENREGVIGRRLSNGAPLTGHLETDAPDLNAVGEDGLKVIPDFAHIRRAAAETMDERFFRRPFNYEQTTEGRVESGLLWTAYARNLTTQYIPVQTRLAKFDLLNVWTTPVASSAFVIAPGFEAGEVIAAKLFS